VPVGIRRQPSLTHEVEINRENVFE